MFDHWKPYWCSGLNNYYTTYSILPDICQGLHLSLYPVEAVLLAGDLLPVPRDTLIQPHIRTYLHHSTGMLLFNGIVTSVLGYI